MANEKTVIEKLNLNSMNIAEEKQNEILRLLPEIRTEGGKVDFEKLKLALGQVIDIGKERYGMMWPGKAECFKTIQTPSMGTLSPKIDESVNFETSDNLIIEGDNLEVLKLLQKSYLGKIKAIYIDPPYNTGSDFIYPDNYTEGLQTYLEYTGQADSEGKRFGSNTDTDGRFHSKWMNMIYPRLYLARNLLKEDGIIFISIDDSEVENLKKIGLEIFGEDNFLAQLVWKKKYIGGKHAKHFADLHEYILVFAKNVELAPEIVMDRPADEMEKFEHSDEYEGVRGKYYIRPLKSNLGLRKTLIYPIKMPDGKVLETQWMVSRTTLDELVADGRIVFKQKRDGEYNIYRKFYEKDNGGQVKVPSLIDDVSNADGKVELKEIFNIKEGRDIPFDNPKPTGLIKYLVRSIMSEEDIFLDFFAGSGSSAHAILDIAYAEKKKLNFILVQLPEQLNSDSEFSTISSLCIDRVRKVIQAIAKLERQGSSLISEIGIGFKVFKLSESNFKTWSQDVSKENIENQLELHVDHVKHERTADDILYEILLKSGFPLTTKVEIQKFEKQTVYSIADGMLLVCLEDSLTLDLIKHIAEQKPERVVCLDQGFANNDQLKTNAVQIFRTKGIASFKTV